MISEKEGTSVDCKWAGRNFKRWISLTSAGRSKVLLRNAYKKMKQLDDLLKTKDRAHEMSV